MSGSSAAVQDSVWRRSDHPGTRAADPESLEGWRPRPVAAFGLRTLIFATPLAASVGASWFVARRWERPPGLWPGLGWWVGLIAVATIAMVLTDRFARRLLPLSTLLRMSLVFPDTKPSRFGIALRTGTTRQLRRKLDDVREHGLGVDERVACERLLELVAALRAHDRFTRGHGERVRAYAALIGRELGLGETDLSKLQWAGLVHDVGKLAVPDEILNKTDPLTADEWTIIRTHPAEGMELVEPLAAWLGEWSLAVGQHHERWDGTGYPRGLAGTEISRAGRIVAVADAFDVITAARSYKPPRSPHLAREELARHAGSQFDPAMVRAFLNVSIGRLRAVMWPLSWFAHLPYLGSSITAPAAGVIAPALVAVSTAVAGGALADELIGARSDDNAVDERATPAVVEDGVMIPAVGWATSTTLLVVANPDGPPGPSAPVARSGGSPDVPSPGTGVPPERTPSGTLPVIVPFVDDDVTVITPPDAWTPPSIVTIPPRDAPVAGGPAAPPPAEPAATPGTTVAPAPTTVATTTTVPDPCTALRNGATRLAGADLRSCDLSGLVLDGVDLSGADLTGADLRGAVLSNFVLDGAVLTAVRLDGAELTDGSMVGVTASGLEAPLVRLTRVDLAAAELTDANLTQSHLADVSMSLAVLVRPDFDRARLTAVDLTDAQLLDARFTSAAIHGTVLRRASATAGDFSEARLNGSKLDGADFRRSSFDDADFRGATGTPASTADAEFDDTICPDGVERDTTCWP